MGKIYLKIHEGIEFWCRENTSDEKAFNEVVIGDVYQKRGMKINEGEHWLDLGGNVGAFAIKAISEKATVDIYEPDPISCKMIEKNLKQNGFDANVYNVAVVGNNDKTAKLSISKTHQYWRNSLVKNWKGGFLDVECVNFNDIVKPSHNVKMDIEGSEMEVLEKWNKDSTCLKLVFEWSFDMDDRIDRYREVVKKMEDKFNTVKADKINEKHKLWQSSWFPPCKNVYCY